MLKWIQSFTSWHMCELGPVFVIEIFCGGCEIRLVPKKVAKFNNDTVVVPLTKRWKIVKTRRRSENLTILGQLDDDAEFVNFRSRSLIYSSACPGLNFLKTWPFSPPGRKLADEIASKMVIWGLNVHFRSVLA